MAKGHDITVFEPVVWFSPNQGTQVLPKRGLAYNADYPTGWIKIPYTANGVQITFVNPKQDINTDEIGVLKSVPAGTHTINVTLQARTPFKELVQKISSLKKTAYTTRAEVEVITFSAGVTTNGNITITLGNGVSATIAVTSASQSTPTALATAVAAGTFTGWTTTANPTGYPVGTVLFTQSTPAFVTGYPSFTPNATGATAAAGSPSIVSDGYVAHDRYNLDPRINNYFLLGVDGHYNKDSFGDTGGRVRVLMYAVEQTDNPQFHMRTLGNDSLLQPTLTARCTTSVLDATTQLAPAGLTTSDVDEVGRFDMWDIPNP